jgi:hypothetical protein
MAQYRVLKKSYIHDRIYEPGEVVEYAGEAGTALEPIGAEKRPPEPSRITGRPGPDPASPPPQSKGKSEFDPGGPTRATAQEEYDEKRLADQEVDVPATEPQALARRAEAEAEADGEPPPKRSHKKVERPPEAEE